MSGASYEIAVCPACSAADHEVIADQDELKSQQEDLWRFQLRRRTSTVPPEQLYDRAFFTQSPPLQVVRCVVCGTVYRNPRERAEQLVELYSQDDADEQVFAQLLAAQQSSYRRQARLLTRIAGGVGSGLELGSYVGAFLCAARAEGWRFEGVDVNEAASAFAERQGFRVWRGGLEAVPAERQFDAIAIWNCFDQLPAPRATLVDARNRLRAGGIVAIRVPNGEQYATLVRGRGGHPVRRAVLAYNNLLGFPYRHGFTPSSLQLLLQREQFEVLQVRPDVLVPTADRWTKRWARLEERLVKQLLRWARVPAWFEVYARTRA